MYQFQLRLDQFNLYNTIFATFAYWNFPYEALSIANTHALGDLGT